MSTTFEVYPRCSRVPTFREILDIGRERLWQQLSERGVQAKPGLELTMLEHKTHSPLPWDVDLPAVWGDAGYLWFSIENIPGGFHVDFWRGTEDDMEFWNETLSAWDLEGKLSRKDVVECLSNGFYWNVCRSGSQHAMVHFAYGIVAAVFAELSDGFLYSSDAAWGHENFPAKAEHVYQRFFRSELENDPQQARWMENCLLDMRKTFPD